MCSVRLKFITFSLKGENEEERGEMTCPKSCTE